jgi:hypothetical protein
MITLTAPDGLAKVRPLFAGADTEVPAAGPAAHPRAGKGIPWA